MSIDKLKEKIKIAHEAVKDEAEPYKLEAFKIILESLVQDHLTVKQTTPTGTTTGTTPTGTTTDTPKLGLQELATKCGISIEELKNVVSINDDKVIILPTLFEGTESARQTNAAQCVLICYEIVFKKEWIQSHIILECLGGIGIFDPNSNFSTNMKNKHDIFIKKPKSHEYKLTVPKGRNSAHEIIKKLANGEVVK